MVIKEVDPIYSFRLLLQGCLGALCGVFLAALIASYWWPVGGKPEAIPDQLLAWNLNNVLFKPREKGFYLIALLLGGMFSYVTTRQISKINLKTLLAFLLLSVPVINFLLTANLQHNQKFDITWIALLLCLGLSLYGVRNGIFYKITKTDFSLKNLKFDKSLYFIFIALIILLMLPFSFTQVAAKISMKMEREMHVVSFMVGPALYFFGDHLLPGLDYFTQYSLGMGWVFYHFLGSSAETALTNYIYFVTAAIILFYSQLLYLLHWLYRSWLPAAIVTFVTLILLFHTNDHFFDPSSTVLRYPFYGVCAFILAKWIANPRSKTYFFSLAAVLAISLFLNTETGIIFYCGTAMAILLSSRRVAACIIPITLLMSISILIFCALLAAVYGKAILSLSFAQSVIEPLLIYGKIGFGGTFISWSLNDINWFYNLVAPAVSIVTLALVRRSAIENSSDRPRLAVLAFFSITGLLMLCKYVNMSIIAVWQMNALGLFIPFVWWCNALALQRGNWVWTLLILASSWLVIFANDTRNMTRYGLRSWITYRSFITEPFRPSDENCKNFNCVPNLPTANDISLIRERSKPGEPVAILDDYDWTYLLEAQRPPLMSFLPSTVTFTRQQLNQTLNKLKDSSYLFLPKGNKGEPQINQEDFKKILLPNFHQFYIQDGESDHLVAWRRINN